MEIKKDDCIICVVGKTAINIALGLVAGIIAVAFGANLFTKEK